MSRTIKVGNTYFFQENCTDADIDVFEINCDGEKVRLVRTIYQPSPHWRLDCCDISAIERLNLLDVANFIVNFERHQVIKQFDKE